MKSNKKDRKPNRVAFLAGLMIATLGLAILLLGGQGNAPPTSDGTNFCDTLEEKPIFNYTLKLAGTTIYYYNGTDSDDKLYIYTIFINGSYSIEDATINYVKYSMSWKTLYDFYLEDANEKELVSSQGYCWLKRMIWWIELW